MTTIDKNTGRRILSLDLLRIIAMLMVVGIHSTMYSCIFETNSRSTLNYCFAVFLKNFCIIAVNCYVMISGYFLCKAEFKPKRIFIFWSQTIFYSIVFWGIFVLLGFSKSGNNLWDSLRFFVPIISRRYWFVSNYIILFLLTPFLNLLIARINKAHFYCLLGISFFWFSLLPAMNQHWPLPQGGFSLVWFVVLYLTGAYIQYYQSPLRISRAGLLYLATFVGGCLLLSVNFVCKKNIGIRPFELEAYNFPLTYLTAITFFLFFRALNISETTFFAWVIRFLSPLTLGVYLIHENEFVRPFLWRKLLNLQAFFSSPYYPLLLVGSIVLVYLLASVLEWFRRWLFAVLHIPAVIDKIIVISLIRSVLIKYFPPAYWNSSKNGKE